MRSLEPVASATHYRALNSPDAHAMRVGTDRELKGDCAFFASCPVNDLYGFLPQCEAAWSCEFEGDRDIAEDKVATW